VLSGYDLRKHLMMVGGREISKKEKKNEKKNTFQCQLVRHKPRKNSRWEANV